MKKNILIIWAWVATHELLDVLWSEFHIIWLIDDIKEWFFNDNLKIIWKTSDLEEIISTYKIDQAFISMPSVDKEKKYNIWKVLNKSNIEILIIPDIIDILSKRVEINLIREININDILWRPLNKNDILYAKEYIEWEICLVTWAAGSIWSELVKQLSLLWAKKVYCLDRWENGLFYLIQNNHNPKNLEIIIWDIQDKKNLINIFKNVKPKFVFHAAAYKHVHFMESFPKESFKNNVFWTRNVLEASIEANVDYATIVSTDKAINPSSIMWATKRISEKLMEIYSTYWKTKISAVRFWNVIWSEGSVFHIFKKQIDEWLPITITDMDVTRYMMTIPESVQLIIQSTLLWKSGEIFLLDMWKPIKIIDFLKRMLELKWVPFEWVIIDEIWLKKWEKLHEEIILDKSKSKKTHHNKIWTSSNEENFNYENYIEEINNIEEKIDLITNSEITIIIKKLVPNFLNNE